MELLDLIAKSTLPSNTCVFQKLPTSTLIAPPCLSWGLHKTCQDLRSIKQRGQFAFFRRHSRDKLNAFTRIRLLLLIAAVSIGLAITAMAQSSPPGYPQWYGQNRDGVAGAFAEPKVWPEKLTRRWKVKVGEGYATPIVVGNTVYSFTRSGANEVMMALNAATGQILWKMAYSAPYKIADTAAKHGAVPKATPLFHNGKLYTLGVTGIVSAFDAITGKLVWQKPAPPEQPHFGMGVSPIGDKDLVIVPPDSYGPLIAFDASTGAVKWTANGDSAWVSSIIVELGGTRQVVSMTSKTIIGVSAADGALLWQHPRGSSATAGTMTPIVCGETIIVGSQRKGLTAIKPIKRDGKWVADVAWETKEVSIFLSNPALIRDTLFGLSERASGRFFALDAKTGRILWLGQPRGVTNTAIVKAGDLLFFLNDDAELLVVRSSQTGFEPLKRYTIADSATWTQPAISDNRLFIKDVTSLAMWSLK
jgi:outer membrane protein assembly factor BamB